jgi:O-acetyl-ADP-ribose deacetylase (regulator of RNase III)
MRIIQGDITQARVDAIVNAANSVMLGGGGVDGAIHRAAGPALLQACKEIPEFDGIRCPTGEARITTAGDLNARFVIHTVGPRYGVDPEPEKLLANAYTNSLNLALDNGCETVAFPAISCGVYGYPYNEAASIAIKICSGFKFEELDIAFYLYGNGIVEAWQSSNTR